jgi:hypothetical protein
LVSLKNIFVSSGPFYWGPFINVLRFIFIYDGKITRSILISNALLKMLFRYESCLFGGSMNEEELVKKFIF